MRRGTTPTNTFTVPIDLSDYTVYISYQQNGKILVEKTGEDLTFNTDGDTHTITLSLSQEDTLAFAVGDVQIQLRYVTPTGEANASNIILTNFDRILKDGVITYV